MKKLRIESVTLFCDYMSSNGTSSLYLVNTTTNEVIDSLDEAIFGAQSELGANHGVYAETCGGYAGQIHGAAYLDYDGESIMHTSNLEPYECECEECETKGYEESSCHQKDFSMIEYMDESYDGEKLYWVEFYALQRLAADSPVQEGFKRIYDFLAQYINSEDLIDSLEPNEMQKVYMLGSLV